MWSRSIASEVIRSVLIEDVPLQRHITGVLENTRVFDEKYPGIFQYPGFIDKYPGIFHQIPGYLTACQIPG